MVSLRFLNRLLPFATTGTPLILDLVHLLTICVLLYFAPQVQERWQQRHTVEVMMGQDEADLAPQDSTVLDRDPGVGERVLEAHQNERDVNEGDDANIFNDAEPAPGFPNDALVNEGEAGPAGAPNLAGQRNVGAKKAKSLARKDQRRAYNEFMRSQGEAQRARDAQGAAEREAALATERDRRRKAAEQLEAEKAKERKKRREREEQARREDSQRRELVVSSVREALQSRRTCSLFEIAEFVGDDVDEEWVEKVVKASGLIGKQGDVMTMMTATGWIVRVTAADMAHVYEKALNSTPEGKGGGRVDYHELGDLLEATLRRPV